MDTGGSESMCRDFVDFLIERNYLLTALELLHELLEDGQDASASKLKQFFADPERFPPDQLLEMQTLPALDAHLLFDEKEAAMERAAMSEYELRLAREDLRSLQDKLEKQGEVKSVGLTPSITLNSTEALNTEKNLTQLEPLTDVERRNLNCAVKEYLVTSGYKVTAMTFLEEVEDQELDEVLHIPDALRRYYLQFLSTCSNGVEESISLKDENEVLLMAKVVLEKDKAKLSKLLEASLKEAKEKEKQELFLRESLERAIQEAKDFKIEVTSLKLELENSRAREGHEMIAKQTTVVSTQNDSVVQSVLGHSVEDGSALNFEHQSVSGPGLSVEEKGLVSSIDDGSTNLSPLPVIPDSVHLCYQCRGKQAVELETVQILAEALPKIIPYVLINHREELLPLMMCAIERHPNYLVRDSLTHHLFNLIKRPDELQRRIIMDACVSLSKSLGEMRTETELLPQCWEQINHKYEERRLLVAQSCGELGRFVRPEMRTSLILSIVQQLVEDSAAIVREAAAHNLALLLLLFSDMNKYFKVEELLFRLVLDSSGIVVETTLQKLLPSVLAWLSAGNKPLHQLLCSLIGHMLAYAKRCPPLSGVEGSPESHLRILGEKERWNTDILLQMLIRLLPAIRDAAVNSCPLSDGKSKLLVATTADGEMAPDHLAKLYTGTDSEWPVLDWMFEECFPALLELACMLPAREEILRTRLCKVLLSVDQCFGGYYHSTIVVPIFLTAVGDNLEIKDLSPERASRIMGLKPKTTVEEQLAIICVLPLLLAGVLGAPSVQDELLPVYLRDLILQSTSKQGAWTPLHTQDLIDAVRFLCTFKEQHGVILGVLWDLVVNSSAAVKVTATVLTKALVGYVDLKLVTQQVLPALVTLASDPNVEVKHSSIEAFGAVAQHFKDEPVIDKIRVQLDAFLEDGSHEAVILVVRTLAVSLPVSASSLRDYLLQKLLMLSSAGAQVGSLMRRRERADAFCEAIRALDATDLSATSVKDLLVPTVQNLLKDPDSLDPAHKEALEVILKERSVNRLESISKAMGMSTMGSLFGDGGFLSKKDVGDGGEIPSPTPQQEQGMLRRMMRTNYGGNIFSRNSGTPE